AKRVFGCSKVVEECCRHVNRIREAPLLIREGVYHAARGVLPNHCSIGADSAWDRSARPRSIKGALDAVLEQKAVGTGRAVFTRQGIRATRSTHVRADNFS